MKKARMRANRLALCLVVAGCGGAPLASPSVPITRSTAEPTTSAPATATSPADVATPSATIDLATLSGRIAFSNFDDVWVVDVDGTDVQRLTDSPWHEFDPSLSPDGRFIAYRSEPSDAPELWLMNADGSGQHQLTPDGGFPTGLPMAR